MHIKQITTDELELVSELFSGYRDFYQASVDLQKERAFLAEHLQKTTSTLFYAAYKTISPLHSRKFTSPFHPLD